MEYSDVTVEEVPQAEVPGKPLDPSLLAEARIKAKKLREFVKETADEWGEPDKPASPGMIRDYNVLRALVVQTSPRLVATLPPEIPAAHSGEHSRGGEVSYRELIFFCDQIKEFLDRWVDGGPVPRIDDGASLFGPDGLAHDPGLLAAARVKAQTLLDFVEHRMSVVLRVPVTLVEDYNRLLALIREAAPGLESVLPGELRIPAEPKPMPEDQPGRSFASRFFGFSHREERHKTPRYADFLYHCQQIVRLLK